MTDREIDAEIERLLYNREIKLVGEADGGFFSGLEFTVDREWITTGEPYYETQDLGIVKVPEYSSDMNLAVAAAEELIRVKKDWWWTLSWTGFGYHTEIKTSRGVISANHLGGLTAAQSLASSVYKALYR